MDEIDEAVVNNLLLPEKERLSNVRLAKALGVNEATIRRRRKRLKVRSQVRRDEFFDVPVNAVVQRGKTVRLPDGSYEKITYRPGAVEAEEVRGHHYTDLVSIFAAPPEGALAPDPDPDTLVVCVPDLQIGKTDEGGGTPETVKRVVSMLGSIERHVKERGGYKEIVLADVGDLCEGFWNVPSQAQTNDLSLTDQIRTAQRLMAHAVRVTAPLCETLVYVAVPSNHCQVRTGVGGKQVSTPDDDFGLLIQDNIGLVVDGRAGYEHVRIVHPSKYEETVTVRTHDGTGVAFTHGHVAGSQDKVPGWFTGMAFGRRSGTHEASVLVHGHWHTFGIRLVGDNRTIISCPSADNGSAWYANKTGTTTRPALLTFTVSDGTNQNWRLWYV